MKRIFKTLMLICCLAPVFWVAAYADVAAIDPTVSASSNLPVSTALIACGIIACAVLIYILRKKRNK